LLVLEKETATKVNSDAPVVAGNTTAAAAPVAAKKQDDESLSPFTSDDEGKCRSFIRID